MPETKSAAAVLQCSGIAFGTSGARGLVEQFTEQVCAAFSTAFLAEMRERFAFNRVAIAIDRRPSSPRMAAACAGAARGMGLDVDYCGVLPTPALALQALADGMPAIMITGSHIPFDRNGIKFYRPDGEIEKADEQAIAGSEISVCEYDSWLPDVSSTARARYIRRYIDLFPAKPLMGRRIGLYEHSAAGRDINAEILRDLGAEVIALGRSEEFVPIDTEAVSPEDRAKGIAWAVEHRLDALFSTDGDGDRPLLADEKGQWLRGDIVGLLCARELGIDALAVPVSCNTAIERCGAFSKVVRTRIGSPYVIEGMTALARGHGRVAGFEANGGFLLGSSLNHRGIVLEALPTRDALLPTLTLLVAAARRQCRISELAHDLPGRHTVSDRLQAFSTDLSRRLLAKWVREPDALQQIIGTSQPILQVDTTDGLRVTLANGDIVHLRPSGNAPELRCYVEADSEEAATELLVRCLERLPRSDPVRC